MTRCAILVWPSQAAAKVISMSSASFEQFRQLVLSDPGLQQQLRATPDLYAFLDLTVQLGVERGYDFSVEEVQAALQASRRAWLERWV